ncbi:BTB/POZ protein [Gongronella butleri]|nr:BTB/POZ protein [Gongronella butleri]
MLPLSFSADANDSDELFDDLCSACKEGDLEKVYNLVKNFGAPVNKVDRWACSALYWACLCGHYDVVQFLLENGSKCDPNTFQGERCYYGALTQEIRRLLFSYKITKAVDVNQPYLTFMTEMLVEQPYADVQFLLRSDAGTGTTTTRSFSAHRFILSARSPYFRQHLEGRWANQHDIKLNPSLVDAAAFDAVLCFIYTGQLHTVDDDVLKKMIFVCQHLNMPDLVARCERMLTVEGKIERDRRGVYDRKEYNRLRRDMDRFVQHLLFSAIYIKSPDEHRQIYAVRRYFEMDNDNGNAADGQEIDGNEEQEDDDDANPSNRAIEPLDELMNPVTIFPDVAVYMASDMVLFPCHKAILCRSSYFKCLIQSDFAESATETSAIHYDDQTTLHLPVLHSDVPADVFQNVLEFLYTDRTNIEPEDAYDVLLIADMLLIERLKAMASIVLTNGQEPLGDIYDLMQTAWDLNVERLEHWCTNYFAQHLDEFINQPAFHDLIRQSAMSIANRQSTDSIPFVDDVRYYLGKMYDMDLEVLDGLETMFEADKKNEGLTDMEKEYNNKLEQIDMVLENLGLDA